MKFKTPLGFFVKVKFVSIDPNYHKGVFTLNKPPHQIAVSKLIRMISFIFSIFPIQFIETLCKNIVEQDFYIT